MEETAVRDDALELGSPETLFQWVLLEVFDHYVLCRTQYGSIYSIFSNSKYTCTLLWVCNVVKYRPSPIVLDIQHAFIERTGTPSRTSNRSTVPLALASRSASRGTRLTSQVRVQRNKANKSCLWPVIQSEICSSDSYMKHTVRQSVPNFCT